MLATDAPRSDQPSAEAAPDTRRETIVARGIFAGAAGALVLFTEVRPCTDEQVLPFAQIFVSTNAGSTWAKRGPEIEGSSFEFADATASGRLWVVGLHTAEGPGSDPFVMVPGREPWDLVLRPVREGPTQFEGAAREPGDAGNGLLLWIRDIDPEDDRPKGRVRLFESRDDGVTWSTSSNGPGSGMIMFAKISARSGDWRIADRADLGFDVQQRSGKSWETISAFPWRACDAQK